MPAAAPQARKTRLHSAGSLISWAMDEPTEEPKEGFEDGRPVTDLPLVDDHRLNHFRHPGAAGFWRQSADQRSDHQPPQRRNQQHQVPGVVPAHLEQGQRVRPEQVGGQEQQIAKPDRQGTGQHPDKDGNHQQGDQVFTFSAKCPLELHQGLSGR